MHAFFKLQAYVLSLVVWADGKITKEERELFSIFLSSFPESDVQITEYIKLLDHPPKENIVIEMMRDAPLSIAISVLKMAHILAHADGAFDESEKLLMSRLISACGIEESNILRFYELLDLSTQAHKIETAILQSVNNLKEN